MHQDLSEHVAQFTDTILRHFRTANQTKVLLKASLSLLTLHSQYLGEAEKWEQLLENVVAIRDKCDTELY